MGLPKPITYSKHALTAMRERGLEREWVEAAVFEPEWFEADQQRPDVERRFRSVPQRDGRVVRVAVGETDDEIRIITAFLDRRASRSA
jgi:hypothetical protein